MRRAALDTAWDLHEACPASRLVVLDDAGHGATAMTGPWSKPSTRSATLARRAPRDHRASCVAPGQLGPGPGGWGACPPVGATRAPNLPSPGASDVDPPGLAGGKRVGGADQHGRVALVGAQAAAGARFGPVDRVMTLSTWTGSHHGEFLGIAPTGRPVGVEAWTLDRHRPDSSPKAASGWTSPGC